MPLTKALRTLNSLALHGYNPQHLPRTKHYLQRAQERGFNDELLSALLDDAADSCTLSEGERSQRIICDGQVENAGRWRVVLAEDTRALVTIIPLTP